MNENFEVLSRVLIAGIANGYGEMEFSTAASLPVNEAARLELNSGRQRAFLQTPLERRRAAAGQQAYFVISERRSIRQWRLINDRQTGVILLARGKWLGRGSWFSRSQ